MEIKKTITSIFMVPTLKIGRDPLLNNGFINGYISDKRRDVQYENSVYLLFKPVNIDRFREFLLDEYDRTKAVIDDYNYEDGFVVIVYQLDPIFIGDFDLIKKGRYSKTSSTFQLLFPKIVKILTDDGLRRDEISLQYRIFNKTQDLKDYWQKKLGIILDSKQEVWSGFMLGDEILDIDTIKAIKIIE